MIYYVRVYNVKHEDTSAKQRRDATYLIPICVLMDIFEWQEMHVSAE